MTPGVQPVCGLFGLTGAQLQPVVENMAGEAVADFDIAVEREPQGFPGWAGQKLIRTFRWRAVTGQAGETVCCVKRMADRWKHEARHYAFLHAHGFPACRVYGVEHGPEGEEILFLEYLDRIRDESASPGSRKRFLSLRARLNALPLTAGYAHSLHAWDGSAQWLQSGAAEAFLERVWALSADDALRPEMKTLACDTPDAPRLLARRARQIGEIVSALPRALVNGELDYGFRPGTDEMVCFDLHSTGLGPRFADVIHQLAIPDGVYTPWGADFPWKPREEYAACYAAALARWGGSAVTHSDVLAEAGLLWEAQAYNMEWWLCLCLTGEVVWTDDREEAKRGCRGVLHSQLGYLVRQATTS